MPFYSWILTSGEFKQLMPVSLDQDVQGKPRGTKDMLTCFGEWGVTLIQRRPKPKLDPISQFNDCRFCAARCHSRIDIYLFFGMAILENK